MSQDEADSPIRVTVDRPVVCVPAAVMFDSSLSVFARVVASLWFLLEREPTVQEIVDRLGFNPAQARLFLASLRDAPSMREYL